MSQYRTMPCQIEAIQWTDNTNEIKSFCGNSCTYFVEDSAWKVGKGVPREKLVIHTLEGDMVASRNDYIIKGLKGEFYPCKPDVFNQKYELINDTKEVYMEQRWIPVAERLPEEAEHVLLWLEYFRHGNRRTLQTYGIGWQIEGYFHVDGLEEINVFAWQPLPKPYKG